MTRWLEQTQLPPQLRPAAPDSETGLAIRAWNLMGGIDWAGLPVVVDLLGIVDPDILVHQLVTIRDRQNEAN